MADPGDDQRSDGWTADLSSRLDELIDEYRASLHDSLDGLTEEEARLRLVPSKTALLGLVKHVTYVEGCLVRPGDQWPLLRRARHSHDTRPVFTLTKNDTIAAVQAAHRWRCERSRRTMAALTLDDVVDGRGHRPVWALQLQVLRELAQHAGHADILREEIVDRRPH
jgi:hypothetical protein